MYFAILHAMIIATIFATDGYSQMSQVFLIPKWMLVDSICICTLSKFYESFIKFYETGRRNMFQELLHSLRFNTSEV